MTAAGSAPQVPVSDSIADLLSIAEVARIFGRSERTICRWCAAGYLVPIRIGRSVFFRADDIRRLQVTDMAGALVKRTTTYRRRRSPVPNGSNESDETRCMQQGFLELPETITR